MRTTPGGTNGRSLSNWKARSPSFVLDKVWAHLHQLELREHLWNVTALCMMFHHPVIQAAVGIIFLAHFFRVLSLWKLEFVIFMKQLEQDYNVLILEGVLLVGTHLIWSVTPSTWLRFGRNSLCCQCIFSFWLKRLFWACRVDFSYIGLLSFSSALTLAIISSACSPCKTSCFQVWHSPTSTWVRSMVCRLGRQVFINVDWVMPLRHWSIIPWNISTNVLINSPFFYFVARTVSKDAVVSSSKKRAKKRFSKSNHFLIVPQGTLIVWRPHPAGTGTSLQRTYAGRKYPHVYTLSICTSKN